MKSLRSICVCTLALLLAASVFAGQKKKKDARPEATTGGVRGRVRVDSGSTPEGVSVTLSRGDESVAGGSTDRKGEFEIAGVAPGIYSLTFRKGGLKTAELKPYEIRAGKTSSLSDKVFLPTDEGSIAFLNGSVFSAEGRSVGGARVELWAVAPDGSTKRVDGRVSNGMGQFSFRLKPIAGHYRVAAKADTGEAAQDVQIEGAMVYRVALSLKRAP